MTPYDLSLRNTWLEVDLAQFQTNIRIIQKEAGVPVLVVVKANAYGHGLVECGLTAEGAGAAMLGVATLGEGALLREAGVRIPLLRITAYGLNEVEELVKQESDFFVSIPEHLDAAQAAAAKLHKTARVHLKVDTGMGRTGVFADQALDFARDILSRPGLEFAGLASHFYLADAADTSSVASQLARFNQALSALEGAGIAPRLIHIANSPGLLRFPEARFTMVRSGVISYGMPYEDGFDLPEGIKPIAQWKARLVSVRRLPPNHVVSYGAQYTTSTDETIAIIPLGYADGLHRHPKNVNEVLWNGQILPTVGRICMDQAMIRIPEGQTAALGDEVVLLGAQGGQEITSLEIAARWGTNNYDVVCNISPRVPRVYSGL